MYGGILLPPTRKIYYVKMQLNHHNRVIYVSMQHYFVDMQHNYIYMYIHDKYVSI